MPPRERESGSGAGAAGPGTGASGGKGSGSGGGGKSGGSGSGSTSTSTVPGRIGRPPQWTGTRSRKLARLYMYTTLSVDKILKVLEDDVFKPRKNSAQKTIHNMLDHDPRYLRPESREDMNQRIKLLAASSIRSRRRRGQADEPHNEQQLLLLPPQHQHEPPRRLPHSPSYDDVMLHGVKQEMGQPMPMAYSHTPHHQQHSPHPHPHQQAPQQQHYFQTHQQQHQQQQQQHQNYQHTQPHQPSTATFLPPPPPNIHQQQYADFYHPQYQQQQPQQQQQQHARPHPHSMQQTAHDMPPFLGGSGGESGWGQGFYQQQHQQQQQQQHHEHQHPYSLASAANSSVSVTSSRFEMANAPYALSPLSPGMASLHGAHVDPPQPHPHPHAPGTQFPSGTRHGEYDMTGSPLSIYAQQRPQQQQSNQQRERRMSAAAYSSDSDGNLTDVSTETIQHLKRRLSNCSTRYANQVAHLLRRFTISSGSDDPSPSPTSMPVSGAPSGGGTTDDDDNSNEANAQRHPYQQIREHGRQWREHTFRRASLSSDDSLRSDKDSDGDVYHGGRGSEEDDDYNNAEGTSGRDDEIRNRSRGLDQGSGRTRRQRRPTLPVIIGASGDNAGNPRLPLPGDFFNAYRYRDAARCPYHSSQQQQHQHIHPRTGYDQGRTRERRCWCAIAAAVGAAALDDGSFWVLGDGRLAPAAQALLQELPATPQHQHQHQHQQHTQLGLHHRDRFGHTLLHLLAARVGGGVPLQMQLLTLALLSDHATLAAVNTARQTFLHMLAPDWFVGLHEPYAPLLQLLGHLRSRAAQQRAVASDAGDDLSAHDGGGGGGSSGGSSSSGNIGHLVYATDVYGRTFFHRLATFVEDPAVLASIVQHYDRAALTRRDAFAQLPLARLEGRPPPSSSGGSSPAPSMSASMPGMATSDRSGNIGIGIGIGIGSSSGSSNILGGGNVPMVFASEDAFIRYHEALLRIVTTSDSHPGVEDPEGRNGLHCLAEAIVDKRMMDEHRNALVAGRRPPKKKTADKKSGGSSGTAEAGAGSSSSFISGLLVGGGGGGGGGGSDSGGYSSGSPHLTLASPTSVSAAAAAAAAASAAGTSPFSSSLLLDPTAADGAQMATRLRLVQGLLSSSPTTVVDVNHYDRRGQTVLTAFVVHIADDQEDKAKSLAAILETLLAAGARLEGRNRRGETALLVAARLGRKIALATLLDHGANVHARDAAGRGVLDVIDRQCRRHAVRDVALYGRLEACRVLLTGLKQRPLGVTQRPTLLDEWTVAGGLRRGTEPRDVSMTM